MLNSALLISPAKAESPSRPLFVSGNFVWAKGVGSIDEDRGRDITVDANGNIYTVGFFNGTVDFDPSASIFNLISAGNNDIFITKMDKDGNFIWAKQMGGAGYDSGFGITLDSNGNIYTTGYFFDTADFDPSTSTANLISAGMEDTFVTKLDNNGNFLWAKRIGGANYNVGNDIVVDLNNNVYFTGYFSGTTDFDPGAGTAELIAPNFSTTNIFVAKLDSNGSFIWAKSMTGTEPGYGYSIALDSNNNVYTTGTFMGTVDFNPGASTYNLTSAGFYDAAISKLDSNGNFVWAKQIGGTDIDDGGNIGISVDSNNNIYITGTFQGTADINPNAAGIFNLTSAGISDVFVTKLGSAGEFVWGTSMGGTNWDISSDISTDANGDVYITGYFNGTADFDPSTSIFNLNSNGNYDIFAVKLNNNGTFNWAKGMGGTDDDRASSLFTGADCIYITGGFNGVADFDPGMGTSNINSAGSFDIFISKLEQDIAPFVSTVTRASTSPTSAASVDFTVTFSEPVTGVDADGSDFDLFTTGVSIASITAVTPVSASVYAVTVNTGSGNGTIRLDVPSSASITDLASNPLGGLPYTTGEAYTISKSAPSGPTDITVKIGGVVQGTGPYHMVPDTSQALTYVLDGGPVEFSSTNGVAIIASLNQWRRRPSTKVGWTGVSQSMALPVELVTNTYVMPRYDYTSPNALYNTLLLANVDTVPRDITVTIGGVEMDTYTIDPSKSRFVNYPGVAGGPVVVSSVPGAKIIASLYELIRDPSASGWNGQSEMMGLPWSQLSDKYLIPMYFGASNPNTLQPSLYIANADTIPTTVNVFIAGVFRGKYDLAPGTNTVVRYILDGGPVEISSDNGAKIIASLNQWRRRPSTKVGWTGVSQSMALPVGLVTNKYVLPRYDYTSPNALYNTLLLANVDTVPRDITVAISGVEMGTYTINPSKSQFVNYPGVVGGPVVVSGSPGAKIIASLYELIRDPILPGWNGQSEMMGLPWSQLSNSYLLPIYFGASNPNTLRPSLYIAVP